MNQIFKDKLHITLRGDGTDRPRISYGPDGIGNGNYWWIEIGDEWSQVSPSELLRLAGWIVKHVNLRGE
jgi:hypothetical protein